MPTIASVTVRYSRKYQVRKDDWAGFEAMITLAVGDDEANTTDPHEVAAQAFAIARQAVKEQADDLRRQIAEAAERRAETAERRTVRRTEATETTNPPQRTAPPPARANGHASATDEPPF